MKREEIKIGMIGAGVHARANIYASLRLLPGVKIHAISTRHADRANAAAKEFGAQAAYDSYARMLDEERPDAVFVVTDAATQAQITADCLKAGAHVFVEKPLGMNAEQADEIARLSDRTGKHVMVGFMKRFAPSYSIQKEIMQRETEFGKTLSFTGMFAITSGRPGWDDEVFIKVGGIHYVDLLREFFGEPERVVGFSNSVDVNVDQVFSLRFAGGVIGSMFFAGLPAWRRHWEEITVTGERGFVKAENLMSVHYHLDHPVATKGPRWRTIDEEDRLLTPMSTSSSGGWRDLYLGGFVGEVEHFLDSLAADVEPLTSAQDNVRTMALCDAIVAALQAD